VGKGRIALAAVPHQTVGRNRSARFHQRRGSAANRSRSGSTSVRTAIVGAPVGPPARRAMGAASDRLRRSDVRQRSVRGCAGVAAPTTARACVRTGAAGRDRFRVCGRSRCAATRGAGNRRSPRAGHAAEGLVNGGRKPNSHAPGRVRSRSYPPARRVLGGLRRRFVAYRTWRSAHRTRPQRANRRRDVGTAPSRTRRYDTRRRGRHLPARKARSVGRRIIRCRS
jgi:hypothetical protein